MSLVSEKNQQIDHLRRLRDSQNIEIESLNEQVQAYRGFTNVIDDYFEYRCRSEEDQKYVHDALGRLTKILTEILHDTEIDTNR